MLAIHGNGMHASIGTRRQDVGRQSSFQYPLKDNLGPKCDALHRE